MHLHINSDIGITCTCCGQYYELQCVAHYQGLMSGDESMHHMYMAKFKDGATNSIFHIGATIHLRLCTLLA